MTWSIRARLTVWYSAVLVSVLMAGAVAVSAVQARLELERLDGELQRLLLTVEGVMRTEFNEGLTMQASADEASIEVVAPDRALILRYPDGQPLAVWGAALPARWLPPIDRAFGPDSVSLEGKRWRAVSRLLEHQGRRYVAATLAPLAEMESDRSELAVALAAGVLAALVVGAVGGAVIGRQTLRPLEDMARQATAVTERDLSYRLTPPNTHDELGRLATAFNALLARLASALQSQRQFMADASHELRTPVSVVRTTAQVTLARDRRLEEEYRESLAIVVEQSGRLSRLVDAMFLLSRAEAKGLPLVVEPLYLDDLASDCVRALRVLADQRGVAIRIEGDTEIALSGDNTLLRQMLGNLVDNAVRHAASTVIVTLARSECDAMVRVCDDGPGVAEADRDRVFERFVRLQTESDGAGLGLPIARWIAEAHGGRLLLEPSKEGACFTITLPASAPLPEAVAASAAPTH